MTTPIHLDTAARALDALPRGEADEFDAHLADCDTCATEYQEFLATAAMLAAAVAEPRRKVCGRRCFARRPSPPSSRRRPT